MSLALQAASLPMSHWGRPSHTFKENLIITFSLPRKLRHRKTIDWTNSAVISISLVWQWPKGNQCCLLYAGTYREGGGVGGSRGLNYMLQSRQLRKSTSAWLLSSVGRLSPIGLELSSSSSSPASLAFSPLPPRGAWLTSRGSKSQGQRNLVGYVHGVVKSRIQLNAPIMPSLSSSQTLPTDRLPFIGQKTSSSHF